MTIRFGATWLLLFLAGGACSPPAKKTYHKYLVYVDTSFTREEQVDVARGLEEWTLATRGLVRFYVWPAYVTEALADDEVLIARVDGGWCPGGVPMHDPSHPVAVGLKYDAFGGRVVCINPSTGYPVYNIALHEIGHVLGLSHTSIVPSVMSPYASQGASYVTCVDMKQFCAVTGWCEDGC